MADKTVLTTVLVVLSLLIGGFVGAWGFSDDKVVTNYVNVTKEVPTPVVQTETVVVETEVTPDYRQIAFDAVREEVDDEDFLVCDSDEYDDNELTQYKFDDGFTYTQVDDKDNKYSVNFTVKLKFDNGKDDGLCRDTRTYLVEFEDDEDAEVTLQ